MTKRFVFLLVLLLVLLTSTVTVFAGNETPIELSFSTLPTYTTTTITPSMTTCPTVTTTPTSTVKPLASPAVIIPSTQASTAMPVATEALNDTKEVKPIPEITSVEGITYYSEKYSDLFFNKEISSKENFIMTVAANKDVLADDPLRFILSGSVRIDENNQITSDIENNSIIILLFIKRDGVFEPLLTVDAKQFKDTNLTETTRLLYAKVLLDNLGNDKVNEIRMIAFRKADVNALEIDKNLQVTDLKVVARTYTVMERVRVSILEVKNIFQILK